MPDWQKAILAGLLIAMSIVFPYVGLLVVPGVYLCIRTLFEAKTFWQTIKMGWLIWFVKGLLVVSFFWSVYPVESFPIQNIFNELGLIFVSWALVAFAISIGGVVVSGLVHGIKIFRTPKIAVVLLVPLFWVLGELVGSLSYSAITLGSGSSVQAFFSVGYVGYALISIPGYLGWAVVAGVYGLTLILICLVTGWYFANNQYNKKIIIGAVLLLAFVGFGITALAPEETNTPTVLSIDTFFPANSMVEENAQAKRRVVLDEAVNEARKYRPDYILLPEDSRYLDSVFSSDDRRHAYNLFQFLNSTSSVTIVDSALTKVSDAGNEAVLRSFVFSAVNTPMMSDKRYITPLGEYLPYVTKQLINLTGNSEVLNHPALGSYIEGRLKPVANYVGPVVLFCYESVSPTAVRTLLSQQNSKPLFVAHLVSQAWFHSSFLLTHQLDSMLRVQAVWNRVTIISAGNRAVGKTYRLDGSFVVNEEIASGEGWVIRRSKF